MLNYITPFVLSLHLAFLNPATAAFIPPAIYLPAYELAEGLPEEGVLPANSLRPSNGAVEIINSIVSSVGLKPNFEVREAEISNAAAVNYKGKRYIFYDAAFIKRIQDASQTDWAAVSILAHEIGHHLNGHTLLGKGGNAPALELEADEFSGFVLRQMGASLEEAKRAIGLMSSEKGSASHPKRKARLAAIERGYLSANERIIAFAGQPEAAVAPAVQPKEEVPALAQEDLFKEVHFQMMPELTFYLNRQLQLLAVTEEGARVLGRISRQEDKLVLHLYGSKGGVRALHVSAKGLLIDSRNKVVGFIKNRS